MEKSNLEKILKNTEEAAIIFTEKLKENIEKAEMEDQRKNIRDDIRVLWQLTSTIKNLKDLVEDKGEKPPFKINNTYINGGGSGYMD